MSVFNPLQTLAAHLLSAVDCTAIPLTMVQSFPARIRPVLKNAFFTPTTLVSLLVLHLLSGGGGALAQPQQQVGGGALQSPEEESIVITGRRIGVPVWQVATGSGTLILVGDINYIAAGTQWNSAALDEILRRSNRVLFPEARQASTGLFGVFTAIGQVRGSATLPAGRSLRTMVSPEQWGRLEKLRQQRIIEEGFERSHPYHLAGRIRRRAERGVAYAPSLTAHVRRAVRRYNLKLVPIARVALSNVTDRLVATPPEQFLECLMNTVELAEAGPQAIRLRSQHWVERRVTEVVSSPAERAFHSCRLPMTADTAEERDAALWATIQRLLGEPGVTVAVVSLSTLASAGGMLDRLQSADQNVLGPAWRK